MITKLFIRVSVFALSLFICSVQANNQILQVELEHLIRDCKLEAFKSGYKALEAKYKSSDDKAVSLASFERVTQETKKEKLTELNAVLNRSVHGYWPFAKMMVQGSGALLMALLGIAGVKTYFSGSNREIGSIIAIIAVLCVFYTGLNFSPGKGKRDNLVFAGICAAIALPLAYGATKNYARAFHQDVIIKRDIESLNEIMAFIEAQKTACA